MSDAMKMGVVAGLIVTKVIEMAYLSQIMYYLEVIFGCSLEWPQLGAGWT
jgi:hypothetical protein